VSLLVWWALGLYAGGMSDSPAGKTIFTSSMANMAADKVKSKEFKTISQFKEAHIRQTANGFEPGRRLKLPATTARVCAFCNERARCACPVCLTTLYCNRECQVKHYPTHYVVCAQLAAQPSAAQITEVPQEDIVEPVKPESSDPAPAPKPKPAAASAESRPPPQAASVHASASPAEAVPKSRKRKTSGDGEKRANPPVFKCEQCDKVFKQSSSLKTHKRSHSGIKPFVCSICNKNFSASFALRRHERIHTGEKAFKCEFCGKNFSRKDALKQHERVHNKEGGAAKYKSEDDAEE